MKRTYVIMVAKSVTPGDHAVLRRALQDQFDWIAVDLPGVHDRVNVSVWRKDGRMLTLDDRVCLKMFVAGALAILTVGS